MASRSVLSVALTVQAFAGLALPAIAHGGALSSSSQTGQMAIAVAPASAPAKPTLMLQGYAAIDRAVKKHKYDSAVFSARDLKRLNKKMEWLEKNCAILISAVYKPRDFRYGGKSYVRGIGSISTFPSHTYPGYVQPSRTYVAAIMREFDTTVPWIVDQFAKEQATNPAFHADHQVYRKIKHLIADYNYLKQLTTPQPGNKFDCKDICREAADIGHIMERSESMQKQILAQANGKTIVTQKLAYAHQR